MELVIVLPTYNEAENLPKMIHTLLGLELPASLSVLIVDDNSPDGTGQIADSLAAENPGRVFVIHRAGKQGLGTAYIEGFRWAFDKSADYLMQMDCDFSHNPQDIPRLVQEALSCDCDIVIGSRYTKGGSVDETWSFFRKLLSWWANSIYVSVILNTRVKDATGGFRLWRKRVLQEMGLDRVRSSGYVFQVETIYVAERLGYRIHEVPIYFADRREGQSKMSFRIQFEAAMRVWQVRARHRHLTPADRVTS